MQVFTKIGLVDYEQLEVRDFIDVSENARVLATEWRLNGELVRRDVMVNALRPVGSEVTQNG